MRRRSKQLGAITAEARLEYFLPASIADKIGGTGNYAFCMSDADSLVKAAMVHAARARAKSSIAIDREIRIKALTAHGYSQEIVEREAKKAAAKAKREGKSGNAFVDLIKEVQGEVDRLRAKGVKGPIPVCINRSSGKRGSELPREMRRSNAVHERFHADARRVEVDASAPVYGCYKQLDTLIDPYIAGSSLKYHSLVRFAQNRPKWAAEELLARVEEVRKACRTKRAKTDCDLTVTNIIKHMPDKEATSFVALVRGVEKDYGTPLNVVRAAVRSCKVPSMSGLSKGKKALLVATALPIIPPL